MSWRILDSPEAYEEYLDQADYLEARSEGLGERFVKRVEATIAEILDDPRGWMKVPHWDEEPTLYWRKVKPFRVRIVYYVAGDTVRVIAYAHESRRPGYWRHRLGG